MRADGPGSAAGENTAFCFRCVLSGRNHMCPSRNEEFRQSGPELGLSLCKCLKRIGVLLPPIHELQGHPCFLQEWEHERNGRSRRSALTEREVIQHIKERARQNGGVFEGPDKIPQFNPLRRVRCKLSQKSRAHRAAAEGDGDALSGFQECFRQSGRNGIGQIGKRRIQQGDECVHGRFFRARGVCMRKRPAPDSSRSRRRPLK